MGTGAHGEVKRFNSKGHPTRNVQKNAWNGVALFIQIVLLACKGNYVKANTVTFKLKSCILHSKPYFVPKGETKGVKFSAVTKVRSDISLK